MTQVSYTHDLAIVLGVAAATSIVFRFLKQPSILGYLLAGLIVGPYIPIPLFADPERVHALSEFGVVLVMFVIGIEFRLVKLWNVLPVAGFTALIQIGTLLWAGFMLGLGLGWNRIEALFLGASIAISSTMIVSKVFEEKPVAPEVRSFVLGILVLQDVAAIALIAAMTTIAQSGSVSAGALAMTAGQLALALVLFIGGGLLVVPRLVRMVARLKNKETMVVTAIGICFAFSLLAESLDYSVALGAFVAGLLVSESGRGHDIEELIHPVKDMFAAIFFVSIGMTVDPRMAFDHFGAAGLVFAIVVLAQLMSVSLGGILSGNGLRQSMTAGLSLGQIGEFAFIIAGIGVAAGVAGDRLQPILVTVAILSAFTTPLALSKAGPIVAFVDRTLPRRFKNILVVYESWFERLRHDKPQKGSHSTLKRAVRALVMDTFVWIAILSAGAVWSADIVAWLERVAGIPPDWHKVCLYAMAILVSIPALWGISRNTRHLVRNLTESLIQVSSRADTGMSDMARGFLRSIIWLAVTLGVGIPAAALLRPVLGMGVIVLVLILVLMIAITFFWQSAGRFDAEIHSEAERFVAFLADQSSDQPTARPTRPFFPDIENMVGIELEEASPAIGKSLTELNLRAITGALVITIHRDGGDIVMPKGSERLRAHDLLMVTGATESIAKAQKLLTEPEKDAPPDPS